MNVALYGFMAVGKTTVGVILAERLGYAFIDLDTVIVQRTGREIKDIFQEDGEEAFREIEKRVAGDIASGDRQVIACGGGTVLFEENLRNLRISSTLIHLTADPRTILERVEGEGDVRPLLNVEDRLRKLNQLLQVRQPGYQRAADHTVDTTGKTPRQVADEVMEALKH